MSVDTEVTTTTTSVAKRVHTKVKLISVAVAPYHVMRLFSLIIIQSKLLLFHKSHVNVTLFEPSEHQAASLPRGRTLHTLTAISDDTLFLFGGLSTSGEVLSMFISSF